MAEQTDFGRLLDRLIHERYRSGARFAAAAGVDASLVSRVISGDRAVPKALLAGWAKILGLSKVEAEDFIVEGELSDAPTARKRVRALAARVVDQDRSLDILAIQVDALRGQPHPRPTGLPPGRPASR